MKGAATAQDCFHIAAAEGEPFLQLKEGKHLGVALFVLDQKLFGLGRAHACFPRKALGAHAIDHPEIDRFAEPAFIGAHLVLVQQQACGECMHVIARAVGLLQHGFSGEVGEDS